MTNSSGTWAIAAAGIVALLFAACNDAPTGPQTGSLRISVETTGGDMDENGYRIVLGALRQQSVPAQGRVVFDEISAGTHVLTVEDVADNCAVGDTHPRPVAVGAGDTTEARFEIACIRTEKRIVFVRNSPVPVTGNPVSSSIVVADANGSSILALGPGYDPAWSPDGTKIVFSNAVCDFYYNDDCSSGGLSVVDPETRSLSVIAGGRTGIQPAWSPDGKVVAFSIISRTGGARLHVASLDGSSATYLVTPVQAERPSWSPDGRRIVFTCTAAMLPGPSQSDICVINSDGTGFTRLTDDAANDGEPAWSPDGSTIAFTTYRFSGVGDIALMTATGTGITRLTDGLDPAWSTDGSKLVFVRSGGLFTVGADGSNVTRLTTGNHRAPAWRP